MLMTAQLYERELMEKFMHIFHNRKYMYYTSETGLSLPHIPESTMDHHDFVCIHNDEIIGYFCYRFDLLSKSARQMGLVNFTDKNSLVFISDVFDQIIRLFKYHNLNKIEFFAYKDNPAYPNYERLVKKLGGDVCGILRQTAVLSDGQFHDGMFLEVFRNERIEKYFDRV